MLKRWMRQLCLRRVLRAAQPYGAGRFARPAVVFSPHFDDETLGCGGTIVKKRRAGAPVTLAFIGDGRGSHSHLMAAEQLAGVRAHEGVSAAEALGIAREDVLRFGVPDLRLFRHEHEIVARARDLLEAVRPAEIFLPHREEPRLWSDDHVVTHRAALEAARQWGGEVDVYEYPIWLWRHWPWTSLTGGRHERVRFAALSLRLGLGLRLARCFNVAVPVADVTREKRAALEQHRSQMRRLNGDPRWPILGDVSRGEFLACFFAGHEFFRHYHLPGARRADPMAPRPVTRRTLAAAALAPARAGTSLQY